MNEIRITPTPQFVGFGYELRIFYHREHTHGPKDAVAESLIMKEITEDNISSVIDPIMTLTKEEIQKWLDELWALGIRPSNGAGDANTIESIKYHLEDMRSLVFKEE